jgi:dTDP-4-dehydrorhamnose reductase
LLLGGSGLVGTCVRQRWSDQLDFEAPTHAQIDVLDDTALAAAIRESNAGVVVNLAAWADVDGAEPQTGDTDGTVYRLNVEYPRRLAVLCGTFGKHLVHVSTDYVFDGTNADRPYAENDATNALCWYAETKRLGEEAVLGSGASVCVARIEMPFTGRDHPKRDLARLLVQRLQAGQPIQGVKDQRITPVFLDDAADALRALAEARYTGILHVASSSWTTPYEFAVWIAKRLGLNTDLIQPESFERFAATRAARRPQHSWLDVARFAREVRGSILRSVDAELDAWAEQMGP